MRAQMCVDVTRTDTAGSARIAYIHIGTGAASAISDESQPCRQLFVHFLLTVRCSFQMGRLCLVNTQTETYNFLVDMLALKLMINVFAREINNRSK